MKINSTFYVVVLMVVVNTMSLRAIPAKPDSVSNSMKASHLGERHNTTSSEMDSYMSVLLNIGKGISRAKMSELDGLERKLMNVNAQWNIYAQVQQENIVKDENLMSKFSAFQVTFQVVKDSISAQKGKLKAMDDFASAEKLLTSRQEQYNDYVSEALKLSFTSKTASLLQHLQAKEQITFAELQQSFDKATQAASLVPSLRQRMDNLNQLFAEVKVQSEKIQQAKYVPLMQRLKDYLMGFAAVAIILMFVSMVKSKYVAFKAAKKAAKQYKSMVKLNDNEYPTI